METEIHITYLLKQIRVLKGIAKEKMTRMQWRKAFVTYSVKSLEKGPKVACVDGVSSSAHHSSVDADLISETQDLSSFQNSVLNERQQSLKLASLESHP